MLRRPAGIVALTLLVIGWLAVPSAAASARPHRPPTALPGVVLDSVRFEPVDADGAPIEVDGLGAYRGAVEVRRTPGGLAVINEVPFEDYLLGISEVPTSWPFEAQKAQAIAARTFAMYQLTNRTATAAKAAGADICASDSCQVYAGLAKEQREGADVWAAAVRATANQVVVYRGKPILAKYSSSNGGRAVAGSEPYLRAVDDPDDALSPMHHWHVSLAVDEVASGLGLAQLPNALVRTGDVVQLSTTDVEGASVEETMPVEDFRTRINTTVPPPEGYPRTIPSVRFAAALDPTTGLVEIDGVGFGHGVGMSQWGALGKAMRGLNADAILAAYYSGLKPVPVPAQQMPQRIRVALALDSARAGVVLGAGRRFRAMDGAGRPMADAQTGEWQVVPGPTAGTVRVVAPPGPPAPMAATASLVPEGGPAELAAAEPAALPAMVPVAAAPADERRVKVQVALAAVLLVATLGATTLRVGRRTLASLH